MAASYKAPLRELDFIINEVVKAPERTKDLPNAIDADTGKMFLETIADYVERVSFPLSAKGDAVGCTFIPETGAVISPDGFKESYKYASELGLGGLVGEEKYGGQNLPHYIVNAGNEMQNVNFPDSDARGLTGGAAQSISIFATDEVKNKYLPLFYSGQWSCAMDLTEPGAGSDLGLVMTKAVPVGKDVSDLQNGDKCLVSGNKIFITRGKHDFSENICHYVLARLPGAPEGTAGISLFLVSENKVNDDMSLGENNGVRCTGIEHKMGIRASSTCAMSFENAEGILIGQPHKGMEAMFVMMNDERLNVAQQGLCEIELAFQNALVQSELRVQGEKLSDKAREKFNGVAAKSVQIIEHGNIRKDLVDMKANLDTWRALSTETAVHLDLSKHHPDAEVRESSLAFVKLMTPLLKGCVTDYATAATQKNIQIHGGSGYIVDTGVEQFYRDALISTIYEGTNDIQSIYFTGSQGKNLAVVAQSMGAEIVQLIKNNPALMAEAPALMKAQEVFGATSEILKQKAKSIVSAETADNADDIAIYARDYMEMFGKLAQGAMALKIIATAGPKAATEPLSDSFYKNKVAVAQHFLNTVMPSEMNRLKIRICNEAQTVNRVNVRGFLNEMRFGT